MDRWPKLPPFAVGERVRYEGTDRVWADAERTQPLRWPGQVVTIVETRPGRRGTLRQLRDEDGPMEHDDGEPIIDTTRDGYSIWKQPNGHGICILRETAHEWTLVACACRKEA